MSANLTTASSDSAPMAAAVVVIVATPVIELSYTKLLIAYEDPPNVTVPPLT